MLSSELADLIREATRLLKFWRQSGIIIRVLHKEDR